MPDSHPKSIESPLIRELAVTSTHRSTASSPDLSRIVWRHKWKAAALFSAVMIMTVTIAIYYPRTYTSEAKIFVRVGREAATLDPTATTGQTVTVQMSREREINSILEILRSQSIIDRAVDEIGVDAILARSGKRGRTNRIPEALQQLKKRFDALDPITDLERARLLVKERLRFDAPETTDVVTVSAKAPSPQAARTLVQKALDAFFSEHVRLNRTARGYEFFEQQTQLVHGDLSVAASHLRDAKNEYVLLTIDGQRSIIDSQVGSVKTQIADSTSQLSYSEARVLELTRTLAQIPATVVAESTTGIGHDATDRMRSQLFELEIQEKELAARFTNDHPTLIAIRQQRLAVSEIVTRAPPQRTQVTNAIHTTHQTLKIELLSERATITALRAKLATLQTRRTELEQELMALNDQALQIMELENQVGLLTASYRSYRERLEEARIDEALEREQISSINLVQAPTLSERPTSPRKLAVLAIGILFATAGAGATVITADYLDSSFVTPAQIEHQLAIPVLISIPRMPHDREFDLGESAQFKQECPQ